MDSPDAWGYAPSANCCHVIPWAVVWPGWGLTSARDGAYRPGPVNVNPRWRRFVLHPNARVFIALSLGFLALSVALGSRPGASEMRQHLGAEYYNIARAIVDGRGFSDPFGERTGPTAWMPPLYPALIAGLLFLTQSRPVVAAIVVLLSSLSWAFAGTIVYAVSRRQASAASPWVAVALFCTWVVAFARWTLELTHDVWLLGLFVSCLVILVFRSFVVGRRAPVAWGVFGGLAIATSPILAFSWAATACFGAFTRIGNRRDWAMAAAIAMALAAPWIVRNYATFGHLIPTKSNFYYDAYLANVVDSDGVYDGESLAVHPFVSDASRFEYARLGETSFLSKYKEKLLLEAKSKGFKPIARRIVHRARSALWLYSVDPAELRSFQESRLVAVVMPFTAIGLALALGLRARREPFTSALCVVYAAYLAPYVAVAFYDRYLVPIMPAACLGSFLGFDAALALLLRVAGAAKRGPNPG